MSIGTFGSKSIKPTHYLNGKDDGGEESKIAFWFRLGRRGMVRQMEEIPWIYQIYSPG